jgi:anti-sigma regulatory factor (Ser/Thr protein kinase)
MNTDGAVRVSALVLESSPASVADARRWVERFLDSTGVPTPRIDDTVLVVSELVSNAIRHATGDVVCHAVLLDQGRCCISVLDGGTGQPQVVQRSVDDVGGLGLVIVEQLAEQWGITEFQGGKAVFAVIATADVTPPTVTPPTDAP